MPTKPRRDIVARAEFARMKAEVKRLADLMEANFELIRAIQLAQELQLQRMSQLQAAHDSGKAGRRKARKP